MDILRDKESIDMPRKIIFCEGSTTLFRLTVKPSLIQTLNKH